MTGTRVSLLESRLDRTGFRAAPVVLEATGSASGLAFGRSVWVVLPDASWWFVQEHIAILRGMWLGRPLAENNLGVCRIEPGDPGTGIPRVGYKSPIRGKLDSIRHIVGGPGIQTQELLDIEDRLWFIREHLSLNVSQLAVTIGAGRPAVYAWLRGERLAQAAHRGRIKAVYDVARVWADMTDQALGRYLLTPVGGGETVLDLLSEPSLDHERIGRTLAFIHQFVQSRQSQVSDAATVEEARVVLERGRQIAAARGYGMPDEEKQRERMNATIRRASEPE